jgi:hypothetical protein
MHQSVTDAAQAEFDARSQKWHEIDKGIQVRGLIEQWTDHVLWIGRLWQSQIRLAKFAWPDYIESKARHRAERRERRKQPPSNINRR